MKGRAVLAAGLAVLAAGPWFGGAANAAYLTDWSAPGVTSVSDPVDNSIAGSRDITNVWYRQDSGYHFFRVDFRAPSSDATNDSPPDTMVQIDSQAGGCAYGDGTANTSLSYYVSVGVTNIDEIVDAHRQPFGSYQNHYHLFDPGTNVPYNFDLTPLGSVGGVFQHSENGGVTFEWAVPVGVFHSTMFKFYVGSQKILTGETWDLVGPITTPPHVRITSLQVSTNVTLQVTGTNLWVPVPRQATNLLMASPWSGIGAFSSTYPTLSGGTYTVSFSMPPTNASTTFFFDVVTTNSAP